MAEKDSLQQFYEDFFQEVLEEAAANGTFNEDAFFDLVTDDLIWEGVIPEAERMQYAKPQGGMRVDGYCGDPLQFNETGESRGCVLSLIVLDFSQSLEMKTLTMTDMNADFKRLENYLLHSLDPKFRSSLEVTDPGYDLASLISNRWPQINRVKLYLLTNKVLSERIGEKKPTDLGGREVTYDVWDIREIFRISGSAGDREPLVVDFNSYDQGPLRALLASDSRAHEQVYLTVFPGEELARIYEQWGARLLEQNVRVFLQARSKVNKGIKNTLDNDPEHFFAFNNGITGTAEGVRTEKRDDGLVITSLDNFQIVNGGQTTASVHAAFKRGVDLGRVFVQAKITIVDPKDAERLVPKISEFANSQNKVSSADFFANHPYHVRMEKMSRSIFAPQKAGELQATRWFYERARGSYRDEQAYLTKAGKRKFRLEYPSNQTFSKTDLAKYLMVWSDEAYVVNRGAQKNFIAFAGKIEADWQKGESQFNERYFKEAVAKKIIFNATEKIVQSRPWYEAGGYRSQHVALTIGLVWSAANERHASVNFQRVWNEQSVGPLLANALGLAADCVHQVLMNPGAGYGNISEWAKQERCWKEVKRQQPEWDQAWINELVDEQTVKDEERAAKKDQRVITGIEVQKSIYAAGSDFWSALQEWLGDRSDLITEKEASILGLATGIDGGVILSEKQCDVLAKMMEKLDDAGCPYHLGEEMPRRRRRSLSRRRS